MAKVSLKHIIGSKKELHAVINSLITQLNISIWIEDEKGKLLLGKQNETDKFFISDNTWEMNWPGMLKEIKMEKS